MNLRHGILPFVIWTCTGWEIIPEYIRIYFFYYDLIPVQWAVFMGSFWLCIAYILLSMLFVQAPLTRWERRSIIIAIAIGVINGSREALMLGSRGAWEWTIALPFIIGLSIAIFDKYFRVVKKKKSIWESLLD